MICALAALVGGSASAASRMADSMDQSATIICASSPPDPDHLAAGGCVPRHAFTSNHTFPCLADPIRHQPSTLAIRFRFSQHGFMPL